MKLTFLGAAGEVTGSQHLLETDTLRILLDCGLFQGPPEEVRPRNRRFACQPEALDAVVLSHAHIDHCGNLPGLCRDGFRGPIFCTEATGDLAAVMLRDSVRIAREDAREPTDASQPAPEPLYDEDDLRETVRQLEPLSYNQWHELSPALRLRFADAGHILGSAICELTIEEAGDERRVVFTGDLGRRGSPVLPDPQCLPGCDVLLCESTYANRIHPGMEQLTADLQRILQETDRDGGRVIIPAFSLGRTQQVVYLLGRLQNAGHLPAMPVFVDSPLSNRVTAVYQQHADLLKPEARRALETSETAFAFPGLSYITSQQQSMELNHRDESFVVIAAGGMGESGRVRHHLAHAVTDERNRIVLIGYQAPHTLGRRLMERQPEVRVFEHLRPLNARVEVLEGLSAHADAEDLKWWCQHMGSEGGIGQAFLVHGEPEASRALAPLIDPFCDEPPVIPEQGQTIEV